jgi:tRNA-specific 2-thiouridylase
MSKVILGMSGGVDSSVAAYLLKEQGHDVIGLFMKNWDETDENGNCPASKDYEDVVRVCAQLSIPCYSIEFIEEYRDHVFQQFIDQYQAGYTPNPDVLCNREIKFDLFLKKAREFGCDYLATGHYCQIRPRSGSSANHSKNELIRAVDSNKDQTYFLTAVPGHALDQVLFPIGHLPKPEVREIAKKLNLATHAKKDSTGICFIGERKFKTFLNQYVHTRPGPVLELGPTPAPISKLKTVGQHDGIAFHTLGQRKGLSLGGSGEPWFVADKDVESNALLVVRGSEHPALYRTSLIARDLNWFSGAPPATKFTCTAKTRYRQEDQSCTVLMDSHGHAQVQFDQPQRAITPGQYVVFYQNEICLGGGVIHRLGPSLFEEPL